MKELLLVLLGIGAWQLVVALMTFTINDEKKVFRISIGIIGWIIYGVIILFAKITKFYTPENQKIRLIVKRLCKPIYFKKIKKF